MRPIVHVLVGLASLALGCSDPPAASVPPRTATSLVEPVAPAPAAARPDTHPGQVRVAALNVRWFPDGDAHGADTHATDLDALAAAIAELDVDAIGLEELLRHEHAVAALDTLRGRLDTLTHGRWEAVVDDCPDDEGRQHVGLLYDGSRAERLAVHRVDALAGNERGGGCAGFMRPGLGVALRFASGFDAWLVVVHLDSGTDDRAVERRARADAAFEGLTSELARTHGDRDVIVLGDFNTMGSDRGVSGLDEIGQLEHVLDGAGFRRLWLEPGCTEVSGGRVAMLDHIVVSSATDELAPSARGAVGGPCGRSRCRIHRDDPWLAHVSDHCPVSVSFDGRDLD
ncbi:MAG: endonuclease/exonuclease/phosphatase family protein [Sandaracinaceae bacterium]|nr:endonuclease/exonuclease/phosphatase family protein [Sandaracinaceae bacterium]